MLCVWSCSHSHLIRSAPTTPTTTNLCPEASRVLFITVKSATPEWQHAISRQRGGDARLNHHLPLRHSHLAIQCVSGRQRLHCARIACSYTWPFHYISGGPSVISWLITLADPHQRMPADRRALHISLVQHFFGCFILLNLCD